MGTLPPPPPLAFAVHHEPVVVADAGDHHAQLAQWAEKLAVANRKDHPSAASFIPSSRTRAVPPVQMSYYHNRYLPANQPAHTQQPAPTATVAPHQIPDEYFGLRQRATRLALFIEHIPGFQHRPQDVPLFPNSPQPHWKQFARFIAYAIHRTLLRDTVQIAALALILRIRAASARVRADPYAIALRRDAAHRIACESGPRLWICALVLAHKMELDDTYDFKSWTEVVSGRWDALSRAALERDVCVLLKHSCIVGPDELARMARALDAAFEGGRPHLNEVYGPLGTPCAGCLGILPPEPAVAVPQAWLPPTPAPTPPRSTGRSVSLSSTSTSPLYGTPPPAYEETTLKGYAYPAPSKW